MARDGLGLMLSAIITSGIGMLGWVVAARLLPRADVGQASAFVSGFLLVAGVGDLGLGAALMRWGPRAGASRGALLRRCYAVVAAGSLAAAAVVLWLPTGREIRLAVPQLAVGLFLVAGVGWALFQFQDNVLVALGRARWVPVENAGVGAARVGALVLAAPLLGVAGVLVSWILPALAGVAVISVLVYRLCRRSASPLGGEPAGELPTGREVVRLLGPTYPAKVAASLLSNLVPLLVIDRFGPVTGAVFFVVWMAGNAINYAGTSFAQSVAVRVARDPARTVELLVAGCRRAALLFGPGLALGILGAHPLLSVFGHGYADTGTTLLRLVLAGAAPAVFTSLVVAVFLGHGHGLVVGALESASALGVVGFVALVPAHRLWVIGVGFLVLQLLLAIAAGGWLLLRRARLTGSAAPAGPGG